MELLLLSSNATRIAEIDWAIPGILPQRKPQQADFLKVGSKNAALIWRIIPAQCMINEPEHGNRVVAKAASPKRMK